MSEMRNLLPNPKPANTNGWVIFGGSANIEFRMTADGTGFYVRNIAGGVGRGIQYEFSNLTPGDYCYGLYAKTPYHKTGEQLALINMNNSYLSVIRAVEDHDGRWYTGEFTLPETGCKLLLTPPSAANTAMSVNHVILTTRENWDTMIDNGVKWFDGDGIVMGGGSS